MENKTIGNIAELGVNLTEPNINFDKMSLNKITILTGLNGTGKSIVLKINWLLATCLNNILIMKLSGVTVSLDPMIQVLIDGTFGKGITGTIDASFENATIIMTLDEGKLIKCDYMFEDDLEPMKQPIYMSTDTRLFNDFDKYLQTKSLLGIKNNLDKFTEDELKKVLSIYKIYDIIFLEMFIIKAKSNIIISKQIKDTLLVLDPNFEIDSIFIDEINNKMIYTNSKGTYNLSDLGNGHQSYINMIVSNSL